VSEIAPRSSTCASMRAVMPLRALVLERRRPRRIPEQGAELDGRAIPDHHCRMHDSIEPSAAGGHGDHSGGSD